MIPEKAHQAANRKRKGAAPYKQRDTVKRYINKSEQWRGPATRYDEDPESHQAGPHLCGALIWLRSLPAPT